MNNWKNITLGFLLILLTWLLNTYHAAVLIPPKEPEEAFNKPLGNIEDLFIDKSKLGIHNLILEGNAFQRGRKSGFATQSLLLKQEKALQDQLDHIIPSRWLQNGLFIFFMKWFYGIHDYLKDEWLREMHGVSLFAPFEYNYLAEPFTRQVAYHGLHEVGQMSIDQSFGSFGCTQMAVPYKSSWVIGRNFDFEGGSIFDEDKILKWVFPTEGTPYVSVIFAGMVGAVTGVNAEGVYIALNAAGSSHFARLGTPSTLILLDALQFAKTSEDAVEIIQNTPALITDIFIVAGKSGTLYQVEKTPKVTKVVRFNSAMAASNHLVDKSWQTDEVNNKRINKLTTIARYERANQLAEEMKNKNFKSPKQLVSNMLKALRDRKDTQGKPYQLHHRSAIDGLIATHSVIYDTSRELLFVSQGPSVTGPFKTVNLKKSFANKRPFFESYDLPKDPDLTKSEYYNARKDVKLYGRAKLLAKNEKCTQAEDAISSSHLTEHYLKYMALAQIKECANEKQKAKEHWQKALQLRPAYTREVLEIKQHLEGKEL